MGASQEQDLLDSSVAKDSSNLVECNRGPSQDRCHLHNSSRWEVSQGLFQTSSLMDSLLYPKYLNKSHLSSCNSNSQL